MGGIGRIYCDEFGTVEMKLSLNSNFLNLMCAYSINS